MGTGVGVGDDVEAGVGVAVTVGAGVGVDMGVAVARRGSVGTTVGDGPGVAVPAEGTGVSAADSACSLAQATAENKARTTNTRNPSLIHLLPVPGQIYWPSDDVLIALPI